MTNGVVWHEPAYYQKFRCLGAACEETCCAGWGVSVDHKTFADYQTVAHPVLGPKLRNLITIQPANTIATIQLKDASCPFLSENLCEVHRELGEERLGQACATFPRTVNQVDGAIERSLDLSCPEAARLALLNPEPATFVEAVSTGDLMERRLREVAAGKQKRAWPAYADAVRTLILGLLQNRSYPVAQRLGLVGHFCAQFDQVQADGVDASAIDQLLSGFQFAVDQKLFDRHLQGTTADAAAQLGIVLELVVARFALDYTSEAYRRLYEEFSDGLRIRAGATMAELGKRYAQSYFLQYLPFMAQREHIFEHYLVSQFFKDQMPFGPGTASSQYIQMAAYFAMTRALTIGLAGRHKARFSEEHVVRAIRLSVKTLEHCTTYPARVAEVLATKGMTTPAAMGILTQELTQRTFALGATA